MKARSLNLIKKLLIFIFCVFGLSIVTLSSILFWIYLNPKPAWEFVEARFIPKDMKVTWEKFDLNITNKPDWMWELNLNLQGFVFTKQNPYITVEIDSFSMKILADPFSKNHMITIQDIQVESQSPVSFWQGQPDPQDKIKPDQNLYAIAQTMTNYLLWAKKFTAIQKANINLKQILYYQYSPDEILPLKVSVSVSKDQSEIDSILFSIQLKHPNLNFGLINADGILKLNLYETSSEFFILNIQGKGKKLNFKAPMKLVYNEDKFILNSDLEIKYQLEKNLISAVPKVKIVFSPNEVELLMNTDVSGLPGPVPKINQIKSRFVLPQKDQQVWNTSPLKFNIRAPIGLSFIEKKIRDPLIESCECDLPTSLMTQIEGTFEIEHFLNPSTAIQPVADISVKTERIENKVFDLMVGARLKILQDSHQWHYEPSLNSELSIKKFQPVKKLLDSLGILIPAPLSVLEGTVLLTAHGPINIQYKNNNQFVTSSEIHLDIDLKSIKQKAKLQNLVLVKTTSDFKRIDISAKTRINALEIELPPIDPILGLPKFTHDSRIQLKPSLKKQTSGIKIYFDFELETAQPSAIKLFSRLVPSFIPITVKLQKSDSKATSGFLQINPFKIEYLRRGLFVDSFRINLTETESHDFPIVGDFHVDQTDYRILIHVGGTLGSPKILLESEPYLDRADIISVLLYDRARDQLVGGDAETAGNVQAAMADKAIGLFGLWAFANTPIKSFSYNPVSKVYSATFQVADGLTAGVGTAMDKEANLEIRKRISQRWVLTASWTPQEDQSTSESVILQWEKRF